MTQYVIKGKSDAQEKICLFTIAAAVEKTTKSPYCLSERKIKCEKIQHPQGWQIRSTQKQYSRCQTKDNSPLNRHSPMADSNNLQGMTKIIREMDQDMQ